MRGERRHHPLSLAHRLPGHIQEPPIQPTLLLGSLLAFLAAHPMDLLEQPTDRSQMAAKRQAPTPYLGYLLRHQRFCPAQQTGEHAHAVTQQSTVGGVVNGGLHAGTIHPQLAGGRDVGLPRETPDAVDQRLQRLRLHGVRPAQQRGLVRNPLEIDAHKPAQDQRVGDPFHRLLVTPRVEMLNHQQAQNHLGGGRVPSMHQRETIPVSKIVAHVLIEVVVVEQSIKLDEYRIGLIGQFRHAREDIFGIILVDEHHAASFSANAAGATLHLTTSLRSRSAGIPASRPPNRTAS